MPCGADAVGRNPEKHSRTRQAGPAAEALPVQIGAAGAPEGKDLPERTAAETIDITNIHSQDDTIFQERPYRVRPCRPTRHFLPSRRTACGGFWAARIWLAQQTLDGVFVGPRREMITPWSTNAVEITQNMGLPGIRRIEQFVEAESEDVPFDAMLQRKYRTIDQQVFTISKKPDPIVYIDDMAAYNRQEGLALSDEEIAYLESVSRRIGRKLTDSEVFGFSQVNSEHCRHKIFNGQFVIDGEAMPLDAVRSDQAYDQGASGPRRVGL